MVCLEGTLLCPAASWGHDFLFFFQSFPLPFPLLKFVSFNYLVTCLVSFIWNSQKCPVSQNIWCLIKSQLKNITQTIFQGGSPWATLIHNSVVCLEGTLLCPAASWGDFVFLQSFPLPFPLLKFFSFMVFLWYYYWISMEFLWGFHAVSIPLDSYGISKEFHDVSMIFLWDYYWNSHGISFVVPMLFHVISMIFLWDFCEVPMGFPWYFYDISLGLLLDFYGMSIESKLAVNWNQLKVNSK